MFTNKLIEDKVASLHGHKSLYSEIFYTREQFEQLYGGDIYRILKSKYDPQCRFLDLYEKVVNRR